ncbi:hypothetical protein [Burkholderia pseudomallei]|uniref:hypothetical protein n=1 Tax=Burkholderia pseudomallei TaxID=28450 RepID=UPI000B2192A2|nr:hypothetical protein [Burkholderia pseudomallei]
MAIKNRAVGDNGAAQAQKDRSDGKIDGFTSSGDARHGTDAGAVQDFLLHGTKPDPASDLTCPLQTGPAGV